MSRADPRRGALVLFSGGQDSATCLVWALDRHARVETVGFDYGQRHRVELEVRAAFRAALAKRFPERAARLGEDYRVDLAGLAAISDTALTRDSEFALGERGLPTTFVPGRNLVFLAYAGAIAYRRGHRRLIAGMCETDYSGYPDCRDDAVKAMQVALNLGMETRLAIDTPLMWRDKAATWALADELGGAALVDMVAEHTHTCYLGERGRRQPWGYGCGDCPACRLRARGWRRWRGEDDAT